MALQDCGGVMIRISEWIPITWSDEIPPFGEELKAHLEQAKPGSGSYAAWNLLYRVLLNNDIVPGTVFFTPAGKPYFTENHIFFSLSHTSSVCAVSVADVPTGIDVERADRKIPERVIRTVFSLEEYENYKSNPVIGWCRKEAASKISGRGIIAEKGISTILSSDIEFQDIVAHVGANEFIITTGFINSPGMDCKTQNEPI